MKPLRYYNGMQMTVVDDNNLIDKRKDGQCPSATHSKSLQRQPATPISNLDYEYFQLPIFSKPTTSLNGSQLYGGVQQL